MAAIPPVPGPVVGVLALQGAFREHIEILQAMNVKCGEIRVAQDLEDIGAQALIIPGGESTALGIIAKDNKIFETIQSFARAGKPIWGTCAGLIVLADRVSNQKKGGQSLVGGLDIEVNRNFFGRQLKSFEAPIAGPPEATKPAYNGVFIRAPAIVSVGPNATALADVAAEGSTSKRVCVAVQQGNLLGTAFHPELTEDHRWHRYFVGMIGQGAAKEE